MWGNCPPGWLSSGGGGGGADCPGDNCPKTHWIVCPTMYGSTERHRVFTKSLPSGRSAGYGHSSVAKFSTAVTPLSPVVGRRKDKKRRMNSKTVILNP